VKGASAVPLIGRASVASDRSIIPAGTTLLAEVPLLDANGKFTGQYELRLMVALDVGGAIKGQHFDIYQGLARMPVTVPGGTTIMVACGC
jgi:membrane-bound lytic murein transglycosylase A